MRLPFRGLLPLTFGILTAAAPDPFPDMAAHLQPFVDHGEISGAVALVATKDRVVHLSAVGKSDLATGRALRTDDIFWIASMSKPITTVAVALLVDEHKLSFDDPVEKYLPEFRGQWLVQEQSADRRVVVKASRPVTLRDLATHTSGMGEYPTTSPHWSLAEMTAVAAREPLRFTSGSKWGYSTAGIDALGRVVEAVSGMPFAQFMQRRIFEPIGMTETTFWLTPAQEKRWAHSYRPAANAGQLEEATIDYMYGGAVTDHARPALGGAGLFSTAADVAKFYQMLLNQGVAGGRQILQPATLTEMTHKQTGDLKARPGMPWGLGFSVVEDPTQMEANSHFTPGTFGHAGAYGTNSWADPSTGLIYVFMIQRAKMKTNPDNSDMRRAYQDTIAADLAGGALVSR